MALSSMSIDHRLEGSDPQSLQLSSNEVPSNHPPDAYLISPEPILIRSKFGTHEVYELDENSSLESPLWDLEDPIPRDIYLVLVFAHELFKTGVVVATEEEEWIVETLSDSDGYKWKNRETGEPARVWVRLEEGEEGRVIFTYTSSSQPDNHLPITFH